MINLGFKHLGKLLLKPEYRRYHAAKKKLKNTPRYTTTTTTILGREIELVDSTSFLCMYEEIFERQIYKFRTDNRRPIIIDGGANIGLSTIFFKQTYPNSHVTAFEPDVKVFHTLEKNINNIFYDVTLINKALWISETVLEFMSEGSDGGRVLYVAPEAKKYQVPTVRLRDYLDQTVDFLKLDIEGAETKVLIDCQDLLFNVKNIFVEYHSFANEPQTLHTIINILTEEKFRIHIHHPILSHQPFYERNIFMGMDMMLNIFAFRE